jgi:hypothetical protein
MSPAPVFDRSIAGLQLSIQAPSLSTLPRAFTHVRLLRGTEAFATPSASPFATPSACSDGHQPNANVTVDMSGCGLIALGLSGPAVPADAGWMARICTLKLARNRLSCLPPAVLAALRGLTDLDLSDNALGSDGLDALGEGGPSLLSRLVLDNNPGLKALFLPPRGTHHGKGCVPLRYLSAQCCALTTFRCQAGFVPLMESVCLADNLFALPPAELATLPMLHTLDLSANPLRSAGLHCHAPYTHPLLAKYILGLGSALSYEDIHLVHITDISLYRLIVPPPLPDMVCSRGSDMHKQQRVHPLLAASALQWAVRLITWRRRQLEPPPLFWLDMLSDVGGGDLRVLVRSVECDPRVGYGKQVKLLVHLLALLRCSKKVIRPLYHAGLPALLQSLWTLYGSPSSPADYLGNWRVRGGSGPTGPPRSPSDAPAEKDVCDLIVDCAAVLCESFSSQYAQHELWAEPLIHSLRRVSGPMSGFTRVRRQAEGCTRAIELATPSWACLTLVPLAGDGFILKGNEKPARAYVRVRYNGKDEKLEAGSRAGRGFTRVDGTVDRLTWEWSSAVSNSPDGAAPRWEKTSTSFIVMPAVSGSIIIEAVAHNYFSKDVVLGSTTLDILDMARSLKPVDGWLPLQGSQESEGFPSLHLKADIKPFCTTPKTDHKPLKYRDGALTHWAAEGAWMLDSDVVLALLLSLASYFPSHPRESASEFIKEHSGADSVSEQLRSVFLERCVQAVRSDWHSAQPYTLATLDGGQTLVCAFMGTYSLSDVLADADVRAAKSFIPGFADGGVHNGIAARANLISLAPFIEAMRPSTVGATPKRLLFTGHSLGGGIATLVALRLLKLCAFSSEEVSKVRCITFGMPLLLDKKLTEVLSEDSRLFNVFHSVVNSKDLIPSIFAYPSATLQLLFKMPSPGGGNSDGGTSSPFSTPPSRTASAHSPVSSLRRQSSYEWQQQLSGAMEGLERHIKMQFGHSLLTSFHPFGRYYILADGKVTTLDDSDVILKALHPLPVATGEAWTLHSCLGYHQALCKVTSTVALGRIPQAKLTHPVWKPLVASARLTVNAGCRSMKLEVRGVHLAWVVRMKLVGIADVLVPERHTNTFIRILRIVPKASDSGMLTVGSAPLTLRVMTDFEELMVSVEPPQGELNLGQLLGGPSLELYHRCLGGVPVDREAPSVAAEIDRPCPSLSFSISVMALQELLNGIFHAVHGLVDEEVVQLLPLLGRILFSAVCSASVQEALAEGGYQAKPSVLEIDRLRLRERPQIRVDTSTRQARKLCVSGRRQGRFTGAFRVAYLSTNR